MEQRIVDLWRANEHAARLYHIYLSRLQADGLHDRAVSACRQIRRYAARGPGRKEALFTFSFEIYSLCALKNYQAAWRQLRLRDETASGRRFVIDRRKWAAKDRWELAYSYAPLLYFLNRHSLGCKLLEISLSFWFGSTKARSYDILFHIYNGDEEPLLMSRVTLAHFYRRLGWNLGNWQHWRAFVDGFAAPLIRMAGVKRQELLADPAKLEVFFDNLMKVRAARVTSGVTRGQADLLESPGKVKNWQDATRGKLEQFRTDPVRERNNEKLQQLFPDLRGLAR